MNQVVCRHIAFQPGRNLINKTELNEYRITGWTNNAVIRHMVELTIVGVNIATVVSTPENSDSSYAIVGYKSTEINDILIIQ